MPQIRELDRLQKSSNYIPHQVRDDEVVGGT